MYNKYNLFYKYIFFVINLPVNNVRNKTPKPTKVFIFVIINNYNNILKITTSE